MGRSYFETVFFLNDLYKQKWLLHQEAFLGALLNSVALDNNRYERNPSHEQLSALCEQLKNEMAKPFKADRWLDYSVHWYYQSMLRQLSQGFLQTRKRKILVSDRQSNKPLTTNLPYLELLTEQIACEMASTSKEGSDFFYAIFLDLKKLSGKNGADLLNGISAIRASLNQELANTSWYYFLYKHALKKVIGELDAIHQENPAIAKLKQALLEENQVRDQVLDGLQENHGVMVLPMQQDRDFRMGGSLGACAGFVSEFAVSMLTKGKVFGFDLTKPTLFRPIKLCSNTGMQYPNHNHAVSLNLEITMKQIYQNEPALLRVLMSKNGDISHKPVVNNQYYTNPGEIADKLLEVVEQAPAKVYQLNIIGLNSAHAVCFCRSGENFYYLDSNVGIVRFKDAHDFSRWFSLYFARLDYRDKFAFHEFGILAYECGKFESESLSFDPGLRKSLERRMYYILASMKHGLLRASAFVLPGNQNSSLPGIPESHNEQEPSSRNNAHRLISSWLDIAAPQKGVAKSAAQDSSFNTSTAQLDISCAKAMKVSRRALANEEISNARKPGRGF